MRHGYDLPATGLDALRLPSGDVLISADSRTFPGTDITCLQVDTAGEILQEQIMRYPGTLYLHASALLADGRAVLAGTLESGGAFTPFTILRDAAGLGDLHTFDTPQSAGFEGVIAMPDRGYVALGSYGPITTYGYQHVPFVARVDRLGDTLWTSGYDLQGRFFEFTDAVVMSDGGLLVAGSFEGMSSTTRDLVVGRISPSGQLLWARRHVSTWSFHTTGLVKDADHRLYLAVEAYSNGTNQPGLVAFDTLGHVLWGTLLSGYPEAVPEGVAFGAGGSPALYGSYLDLALGGYVGFLATLDSSGALQASAGYWVMGGTRVHAALLAATPQPVLLAGDVYNPLRCQLIHTDAQGVLSDTTCGAEQPAFAALPLTFTSMPMEPLPAPGLGYAQLAGVSIPSAIQHQVECGSVTSIPTAPIELQAQVVPHPLRTASRLEIAGLAMADELRLLVTDMQGRQVQLAATRVEGGFQLSRAGLANGLYSYQVLQAGQRIASGKLWIAD